MTYPRMNIFIGKNASGKTTVLEAAAVILGAYLTAFKEYAPGRFGHNISDNDVLMKALKPVKNVAATASVNDGIPLPSYGVIMDAVKYSLEEEMSPGQQALYSSRYGEIAVKNPEGTVINFSALSDGYRNVIKIVTDIATKMCILNPYLGKDTLKKTPGVVVIDELDLSLHPTWQRRIIRILKELFPKVQFICATHSPFIIQSLEPGELTALDTILDEAYSGQSTEDIAEE